MAGIICLKNNQQRSGLQRVTGWVSMCNKMVGVYEFEEEALDIY